MAEERGDAAPTTDAPEPERQVSAPRDTIEQLSWDGYSAEIIGCPHVPRTEYEAIVELERDSRYRIRLSNGNDHLCMVKVELDGVFIGCFMMHPHTKCDIERPLDRPMGFIFSPPPVKPEDDGRNKNKSPAGSKASTPTSPRPLTANDRTNILCTFQPEMGGRTIQFDIRSHHVARSQRLEMANDCTVQELFGETEADFGGWVFEPRTALLHWCTAEYDSPVDDVFNADMQVALKNCKRMDDPLRKMSYVMHERLAVILEGQEEHLVPIPSIPTFGNVLDIVRALESDDSVGNEGWFLLSLSGRYLCSSDWIEPQTYIYEMMHKDEILEDLVNLHIRVTREPPDGVYSVYARILSTSQIICLDVTAQTTVRECRHQLALRKGPWGDDPRWLFGGKLLENGRCIGFYGIEPKNTMDIYLRIADQGEERPLEQRDPIAVENSGKPIDSGCLIRKDAPAAPQKKQPRPRELRRGGTVLKGRVGQQFVEVDPIDVDTRFFTKLLLCVVPKEEGVLERILNSSLSTVETPTEELQSSCVIA